ncbi:MAG: host attachment protein [Planctomycetaceae bacterium]|nr:host attachment protein [Planctomycetaceae bacterium]
MTHRHKASKHPTTWILVADRSRARILATEKSDGSDIREVECLVNPEGALRQSDVETDGPGYFRGGGGSLSAGEPHTDYQHKTAEPFAGQIAEALEHGRNTNQFGHLIVTASPMFLGILRQKLPASLAKLVELEIDKDYTQMSDAKIAELVSSHR